MSEWLPAALTTLYLLQMTKAKNWKVEKLAIGLSGEKQREHFDSIAPGAYTMGAEVFQRLVKPKLIN
jgi:hypothetical protein